MKKHPTELKGWTDQEALTLSESAFDPNAFILRTSDRILFKKCRRLWGWMSHLKQSRSMREQADYFWFGTGMHYALEDYHGDNRYGRPDIAFQAYAIATLRANTAPHNHSELTPLGIAMMAYYVDTWLWNREPYKTFIWNGVPQCEVNGHVNTGLVTAENYPIYYGFTIDRMVEDCYGQLWVMEYKSAKTFKSAHLDVDDQVTAYVWCAQEHYKRKVSGCIYQQHKKQAPQAPRILKNGELSVCKTQNTTGALYRAAANAIYGDLQKAPPDVMKCYETLISVEDYDGDKFISRQSISRNEYQIASFEQKLQMEIEDICNSDLPLYPNPTAMCEYMCPLMSACVAMDSNGDYQSELDDLTVAAANGLTQREKEQSKWRNLLPHPSEISLTPQLNQQEQAQERNLWQESDKEPQTLFLQDLGLL